MASREQHVEELSSLLQQLRDSWGTDGSADAVPNELSDLLDEVEAAASLDSPPSAATAAAGATRQVQALLVIAHLALSPNGGGAWGGSRTPPPKTRSRALSLDCLRASLLLLRLAPDGGTGEGGGLGREALAVAAAGARDERWEVRVSAARAAGEVFRSWGRGAVLGQLSSKEGCWLSALLADGYPQVEAAARAALSLGPGCVHGSSLDTDGNSIGHPPPTAPPPSPPLPPGAPTPAGEAAAPFSAGAAAIRGGCEVLRAATAATVTSSLEREDKEEGSVEPRFVDLGAEETIRVAMRALRGGSSLLRLPRGAQGLRAQTTPPSKDQEAGGKEEEETAARVEALELVEAWLIGTLKSSPDGLTPVPWAEEGEAQGAAASSAGAAPGGSLSLEARDAVRALLFGAGQGEGGGGVFCETASGAAVAAVEEYRLDCSTSAVGGGSREAGGERDEGSWRRVYCELLVRLEVCFPAPAASSVTGVAVVANGRDTTVSSSSKISFAAEQPERTAGGAGGGGDTAMDDSGLSPFTALAEIVAEALEETPFSYEQAVSRYLDQDENMPVAEKKALRARGGKRRRWMVASTQLLLRAGKRLCGRPRPSVDSAAGGAAEGGIAPATVVKLLAAALPFQQAASKADDPTEAWLSCVRRDSLVADPAGTAPHRDAIAEGAAAAAELATPIPWEACVHGKTFPRHELPAPWASSPITVKLARELVDAAWSALSLDGRGDGLVAQQHAEALMQALRAAARTRGGWRDEAGVGIKHAAAAAIRRLRFPLVAGAALGHALPLALPLADDHDPAHQAVGFSLLLHVGAEASPTELGWHRGLLLEVLERGIRGGGGRDPTASALCLAAAVRLLRRAPRSEGSGGGSAGRAGIRIAREALAQAARATDGVAKAVMVCGAAALLELPASGAGYAPCEFLRPALLCLLPILQSYPVSMRLDARAATLRAVHALCLSCWPRVHSHASKLLCALLWTCGDCARRASVRESSDGGGEDSEAATPPPLGVLLAANHAEIDASADEVVREYATRLGALVLLLAGGGGGDSDGGDDAAGENTSPAARATLREICSTVSVLRPAGSAMERLADRALLLEAPMG